MKTFSFLKTTLPLFLLLLISCTSDPIEPLSQPEINETSIENLTFTSIDISGDITSNNALINSRGICWNTNPNPTIANNKSSESENVFTSSITDLIANTTYYYRTYVTSNLGTMYGEERIFNTLSLNDTDWNLTTIYPSPNNYTIYSRINLYEDGTTKFDELDLPGQAPGAFITYGTWELDGNNFTYYFDSSNSSDPVYTYTGVLTGLEMNGTYTHTTASNGTWSAVIQ